MFEETDTFDPELDFYPDERLTNVIPGAYTAELHSAIRQISKKEGIKDAWLLLTRSDVERLLKREKNPDIVYLSVSARLDSFFKMLIGRGATLDEKG